MSLREKIDQQRNTIETLHEDGNDRERLGFPALEDGKPEA